MISLRFSEKKINTSIYTGRILNHLSRDMEVLDSSFSNSLRAVLFQLATFITSIVTIAYVFPTFLIPACIISFFYYQISKGYVNAGCDMRRMQSTTRSPIFTGFAETLEGIVTVRTFSAERRFIGNLVQSVDLSTKVCVLIHFRSLCSLDFCHRCGTDFGIRAISGPMSFLLMTSQCSIVDFCSVSMDWVHSASL